MQHKSTEITSDRAAALMPYATEAQARCLDAIVSEDGNLTLAAKGLGITRNSVKGAFRAARVRAARRGFAPEHGWQFPEEKRSELVGTVPDGFKVKGVSDLVDDKGNRKQAWIKSTESPVEDAHPPLPAGFLPREISEGKDGQGNTFARWVRYAPGEAERVLAIETALRESMRTYVVPVEPVEPPDWVDHDTCGVIPIGDPHIGMLAHADEVGESSDLKIQERDLLSATDHLVVGMPPSEKCTIVLLGDNLHADDDNQRTPAHHHKLDGDGRSHKVARVATNVFRRVVDRALRRFKYVDVEVVGGNHDVVTSVWLRLSLELIYENEPRVTVNPSPAALRVWSFGRCLFATCHGDGIKPEEMMSVISARFRELWGQSEFCYGFQGHRHRKALIEKGGGLVEVFRTMVGKDAFAAKYGYESGQEMVGITYHKQFGEIERKTIGKLLARHGVKL
jgi:hypothetical protein